jgi:hypothetical protein
MSERGVFMGGPVGGRCGYRETRAFAISKDGGDGKHKHLYTI